MNTPFAFDAHRFEETCGRLLTTTGPKTRLEICKLLYFADRYHLTRYGRPIVGDRYIAMKRGPVPSLALDLLEELEGLAIDPAQTPGDAAAGLQNYLDVDVSHDRSKYALYSAKPRSTWDWLSETDVEAVDFVVRTYGAKLPGELIAISHGQLVWKATPATSEMDYRHFFVDEPGASDDALAYFDLQLDSDADKGATPDAPSR